MPLTLVKHETTRPQDATVSRVHAVERSALYLESEERPLFAWLHRPSAIAATHGILICPPVGHEMVHSHRALRHLANHLAAHGFAVLRLDYHGTGDSDGSDHEPRRHATWQANVRDAAIWLRAHGGCEKLSLIGLRMGATLAAYHAEHHEVENLVLWAPITKGRRYVRELTALHQTAAQSAQGGTSIEAVGFVFTEETTQDLAKIDLTMLAPRFRRGLILQSDIGAKESPLFDHLVKLGAAVELQSAPGYDQMLAEPQYTQVPLVALNQISHWLLEDESDTTTTSPQAVADSSSFAGSMVTSGPERVRESAHRISVAPDLFGIITEPDDRSTDLPWIVMLNGGAAHRIGPGRLHVQLSRQLSALGYPCLRMDISGLGDSELDPSIDENDTYPATAFRDVALACDYLQQHWPSRSVVLMGLCSGAYAAFQSLAQLPHPALIESILLNPLTYFWEEGMTLDASPTQRLQVWHYYWGIIFDAQNWRQMLSFKSGTGMKAAVQRLFQRLFPRDTAPTTTTLKRSATPGPYAEYGHPAKEDLTADLGRITSASRRLAMFISENDPGHFLLMYQARRKATKMIRAGQLECSFISDADHTFSTESSRAALIEAVTHYLHKRHGSALPRPER